MQIDRILLGHNPFFGVDHLSQQAGNEKSARFEDIQRIGEMLVYCHSLGVRGMMMSTHPRATAVCEWLDQNPPLATEWRLYPLVPYIQKYVRSANEKGLVNLVMDTLLQSSFAQKLNWLWRGGKGLLTKDIAHGLTMLIDIELLPFKGRPLGAVFLHDALTDLALGLGVEQALEIFRDHVADHYGVPGGFVTKNLPLLRERFEAQGWGDLLAMASFNAVGFQVNPSLQECAEAIRKPGMTFVAMSTLAAGALSPNQAFPFLGDFSGIHSIVVGMSSRQHADEAVYAIRESMPHLSAG